MRAFKAFPKERSGNCSLKDTRVLLFGRVAFLRCFVRKAAGFGGKASNLRRIACWKCGFQFLIQLKVEFSLFTLCGSFCCGHSEASIEVTYMWRRTVLHSLGVNFVSSRREAFFPAKPTNPC